MASINSTTQVNLTLLAIDLEQSLLSPVYVIVLRVSVVLLFTILLLIFELIRQYLKKRVAIHTNLLVCELITDPTIRYHQNLIYSFLKFINLK